MQTTRKKLSRTCCAAGMLSFFLPPSRPLWGASALQIEVRRHMPKRDDPNSRTRSNLV